MLTLTTHARRRFNERITDADMQDIMRIAAELSQLVSGLGGRCRLRIGTVVLVVRENTVVTVYTNKARTDNIRKLISKNYKKKMR